MLFFNKLNEYQQKILKDKTFIYILLQKELKYSQNEINSAILIPIVKYMQKVHIPLTTKKRFSYKELLLLIQQYNNFSKIQKMLEHCCSQGFYNYATDHGIKNYGNLKVLLGLYGINADKVAKKNKDKVNKFYIKEKLNHQQIQALSLDLLNPKAKSLSSIARKYSISLNTLQRYIKTYELNVDIKLQSNNFNSYLDHINIPDYKSYLTKEQIIFIDQNYENQCQLNNPYYLYSFCQHNKINLIYVATYLIQQRQYQLFNFRYTRSVLLQMLWQSEKYKNLYYKILSQKGINYLAKNIIHTYSKTVNAYCYLTGFNLENLHQQQLKKMSENNAAIVGLHKKILQEVLSKNKFNNLQEIVNVLPFKTNKNAIRNAIRKYNFIYHIKSMPHPVEHKFILGSEWIKKLTPQLYSKIYNMFLTMPIDQICQLLISNALQYQLLVNDNEQVLQYVLYFMYSQMYTENNLYQEKWKPYHSNDIFDHKILVSNLGRVKRDYKINNSVSQIIPFKITYNTRYLKVKITYHTQLLHQFVHRLVALTWLSNKNKCTEIDHINTIPFDNRTSNLQWVTKRGNAQNKLTRMHLSLNHHKQQAYLMINNSQKIKYTFYSENVLKQFFNHKNGINKLLKHYKNGQTITNKQSTFYGWSIVPIDNKQYFELQHLDPTLKQSID